MISLSYVDVPPDRPMIEGIVTLSMAPTDPVIVQRRLSGSPWEDLLTLNPPEQNFTFTDTAVLFNQPVEYQVVEAEAVVDGPEMIETDLTVVCDGSSFAHYHDAGEPLEVSS